MVGQGHLRLPASPRAESHAEPFEQRKVRDILGIPDSVEVIELLPLGYPTEWPDARPRKSMDETVCYDGWQA